MTPTLCAHDGRSCPLAARSIRGRWLAWSLACCMSVAAGTARAQDVKPASPEETVFPDRTEPPAIAPVTSPRPTHVSPSIKLETTALPTEFELPRTVALPEASSVTRVRGTLARFKDQYYFVPEPGQDALPGGPDVPPMALMPNQRLEQMATGLISRGDRAEGVLTAQVFNYRGHTHALVTQFSFKATDDAPATPPPADEAPQTPQAQPTDEVAAIVRDLQAAVQRPRALSRPDMQVIDDTRRRPGDEVDTPPLLSERTVLVRKRGRLVRLTSAEGRFAFAFDNDPDSPAPAPMLLHPCAMLQVIEDIAGEHGEAVTFELTGRVTRWGDRNYVLPEFFQVVRPLDTRGTDMRTRQ